MKLLWIVLLVFRMAIGDLFRMVTMHPVEPVAWILSKPRNLMMNPRDERSLPRGYRLKFERVLYRDNCK